MLSVSNHGPGYCRTLGHWGSRSRAGKKGTSLGKGKNFPCVVVVGGKIESKPDTFSFSFARCSPARSQRPRTGILIVNLLLYHTMAAMQICQPTTIIVTYIQLSRRTSRTCRVGSPRRNGQMFIERSLILALLQRPYDYEASGRRRLWGCSHAEIPGRCRGRLRVPASRTRSRVLAVCAKTAPVGLWR